MPARKAVPRRPSKRTPVIATRPGERAPMPMTVVDDTWSTHTAAAAGRVFKPKPNFRSTELTVKLRTTHEDANFAKVLWIDIARTSTHPVEQWGDDSHEEIAILEDEVDTLIATLQAAVTQARKTGVMHSLPNSPVPVVPGRRLA